MKVETIEHKDIEITISLKDDNWGVNWSSYGRRSIEETKNFIEALEKALERIKYLDKL